MGAIRMPHGPQALCNTIAQLPLATPAPAAGYTIQRFESVKTLHILLLVVSISIVFLFLVMLFRCAARQMRPVHAASLQGRAPASVDLNAHC
jgi:small neutral amino acid transporter SnatA (MarC family)